MSVRRDNVGWNNDIEPSKYVFQDVTIFRLPRRLDDVFQYIFQKRFQDVFARCLQDVFKTSCNYALQVSLRHLDDILEDNTEEAFKTTSPRRMFAGKVINKINGKFKFLYRKNRYLTKELWKMLWNALTQPHFDCECPAWHPKLNEKKRRRIKIVQNKCIPICLKLD